MDSLRSMFLGEFAEKNHFMTYVFLWAILTVLAVLILCVALSARLSAVVLKPLGELRQAAESIAEGELDFDVLSYPEKEIGALCGSVEEIRRRLKENALREVAAGSERNLLLANLSHDMRTPITSIKGYAEGLRDGVAASPEKSRQYVDIIYNKAVVLERLVDNMTEYSELEMGRLRYAMEYVDMRAYLEDLAEEYRPDVESRGFQFYVELPEAPVVVVADRNKLKRALDNLVSNALKYNKEGGSVALRAMVAEKGKGLLLSVSDTGAGIKKADVEKVFDVFYRGDEARSNSKGHGLGLAIARQIVEDHHGKIWIKSGEGSGTEVFIYFPVRRQG